MPVDAPDYSAARTAVLPQLCLLAAAVATGAAIKVNDGNYRPAALALVAAAVGVAAVAVATLGRPAARPASAWVVLAVAVVAVGLQLALLAVGRPLPHGYSLGHRGPASSSHAAAVMAGVLLLAAVAFASGAVRHRAAGPAAVACFVGGLIAHFVAMALAVMAVQLPVIDVYGFQVAGAELLSAGGNPYAATMENFIGITDQYGPGLVSADGKTLLFGFPYPPLSLLSVMLPHSLALDVRFAQALAFTAAGAFAGFCGRGPVPKLAAAVLLTTPFGPHLVCAGWTEPLVAVWLAATVWAACRKPAAAGWFLGLFVAAKQYVPLLTPLAWLLIPAGTGRRGWVRLLGPAVAVAAVVTLPLALWNPSAFVFSTVTTQLRQPFRPDALSVLALLHRMGVAEPPAVLGFVALAAAQAFALWRAPRTPAGFAAAVALSLLAFFAFAKQAFGNYYFLAAVAASVALAAAGREPEGDGPPEAKAGSRGTVRKTRSG